MVCASSCSDCSMEQFYVPHIYNDCMHIVLPGEFLFYEGSVDFPLILY